MPQNEAAAEGRGQTRASCDLALRNRAWGLSTATGRRGEPTQDPMLVHVLVAGTCAWVFVQGCFQLRSRDTQPGFKPWIQGV